MGRRACIGYRCGKRRRRQQASPDWSPMLLLDVPIRNEAEAAFVGALAAAATEVLATVPAADQLTLSLLPDELTVQVENLDERPVGNEVAASSTRANALANLQRRLFKEEERSVDAMPDDTVEVFSAPGEGRECVEITRRVLSLARRGIRPRHVAILFRRFRNFGADITRAYVRALEGRRIPHVLVGGRSFHDREEIIALRNALTAIEWPDDELKVFATLRGPFFAVGDEALLVFRQRIADNGDLNLPPQSDAHARSRGAYSFSDRGR